MSDDFIAWLYEKAVSAVCLKYNRCKYCPFHKKDIEVGCVKLTADQKREILMKIYESEVDTNEKDTDTIQANL